jgi:hypothetical protein
MAESAASAIDAIQSVPHPLSLPSVLYLSPPFVSTFCSSLESLSCLVLRCRLSSCDCFALRLSLFCPVFLSPLVFSCPVILFVLFLCLVLSTPPQYPTQGRIRRVFLGEGDPGIRPNRCWLSCFVSSWSCLVLSCLAIACLALPTLALSCVVVLACLVLSLSFLVSPCLVLVIVL